MFDEGEELGLGDVEVYRLFSCTFCKCRIIEFDIAKFLKGEVMCTLYPPSYFVKIFFGMYAWDDRGTEFVISPALHDDADALLKASDINIGVTGSKRIFLRRVFDIHRPEVHEFGLGYFPDNVGEGAVGVEFHKESE